MNTASIKRYAPQARRDFIAAVTGRAAMYGLTAERTEPVTVQGDVAIIAGRPWPKSVASKRARLEERVQRDGFLPAMEAIAYTWFNRVAALRYMELHGYLDHGYRVLSHPDGSGRPEILDHAADVDLPGLDREKAVELKLDGTKDEELYRLLLVAQCNALHRAMPFLFETIEDETELLLPANLLHSDSLIRKLVDEIDEELWGEIEIVGWLYQFYISEKKDQVIGKVVKSEDIPAATQLFTPNWIVKYLVQNSLGAQWLATYPESPLKAQMEFYIEPAEQTDEVKALLAAITPNALNPEELTLIDPACGSGHILVEAYELFKTIYLERGYRLTDIPRLILEKNLFGLDIDERAAQLSGFALMMKARANDRRLFERGVKLNVMALVDSAGFDAERLAIGVNLADFGLQARDLTELKRLFEYATTFGSLIQVPEDLAKKLPVLKQLSEATSSDLFVADALRRMAPLVGQADLLAVQYDTVALNPPYMGGRVMPPSTKQFLQEFYRAEKADLFSCFISRAIHFGRPWSRAALVTLQNWMFLASFEELRRRLSSEHTIASLVHIGFNSFPELNSKIALGCAFSLQRQHVHHFMSSFVNCNDAPRSADKREVFLSERERRVFYRTAEDFLTIPGAPLAYSISEGLLKLFGNEPRMGSVADARQGMATCDNERFLRYWQEVESRDIASDCKSAQESEKRSEKWYSYNKGGQFRRWYGTSGHVVNWQHNGEELGQFIDELNRIRPGGRLKNREYYYRECLTWTDISLLVSARYLPPGFIFDTAGPVAFFRDEDALLFAIGYANSTLCGALRQFLNPSLHFTVGDFANLPIPSRVLSGWSAEGVRECISEARSDWNSYEWAFDFQSLPVLAAATQLSRSLKSSYSAWIAHNVNTVAKVKNLEEDNNRLFIDTYGLQDELTPDVPIEQITLTVNPAYRYGSRLTEEEQWSRFREDTMRELVSYAVGCMMGRYSLDEPGLIYARSGNEGFESSRYTTFPADPDGIIPLTDADWFADDACHRLVEFFSVAWDKTHLEENLAFLAASLSPKRNESSRETLRRYLSDNFFKDHLQTYKKRPIYWLFSSGKQRAFQALVYLHRYHEGSLARMRTEYVVPLQGMIASQITRIADDLQKLGESGSSAQRKKLEKERDRLLKHRTELQAFDEKLRHYADMRIALALDDGVKVNYGKFGDLLADVKSVTGGDED